MLAPKWKTYIKTKELENRVMIAVSIKNWGLSKWWQTIHNIFKIPVSRPFSSLLNKIDQEHNNQSTYLYIRPRSKQGERPTNMPIWRLRQIRPVITRSKMFIIMAADKDLMLRSCRKMPLKPPSNTTSINQRKTYPRSQNQDNPKALPLNPKYMYPPWLWPVRPLNKCSHRTKMFLVQHCKEYAPWSITL